MLFNSYIFLLFFLPVVLCGYWILCRGGRTDATVIWLVLCSLFFYGWWYPPYLALLIGSILVNYQIGRMLTRRAASEQHQSRRFPGLVLFGGVSINLFAIGYFKYADFVMLNVGWLWNASFDSLKIALPLAISFFTFQQIAYLVDCYRGATEKIGIARYFLFVTFFPQLIAGPIVLQRDVIPQFELLGRNLPKLSSAFAGLMFFSIGLFKKVVIADHLATYADLAFGTVNSVAAEISLIEAWAATLTYSLQLYFDFSGYSDMAVGLGLIFGIRLPFNFYSPYKSTSIIEFWRRWHMTLSRFLRECLYIPLGGNQKGLSRRHVNLMIVMLLGGLWHGAGWTFIIWGGLHGIMLVINHMWRAVGRGVAKDHGEARYPVITRGICMILTFAAVSAAWVVFRADSLDAAMRLYAGLFGMNGIILPPIMETMLNGTPILSGASFVSFGPTPLLKLEAVLWIAVLLPIVWLAPNTQQLVERQWSSTWRSGWTGTYRIAVGAAAGVALGLAIAGIGGSTQFLYFQF